MDIEQIVKRQRDFFATGATLPEEFAPDTELCENLIALRERLEQEGRA